MCLFFNFLFFNSPDTTTSLRETTKPIHVEIVTSNYITTVSTDDFVNYDERSMMPTLLGVLLGILIFIAIFCMLCFKYMKGKTMDFGFFILMHLICTLKTLATEEQISSNVKTLINRFNFVLIVISIIIFFKHYSLLICFRSILNSTLCIN